MPPLLTIPIPWPKTPIPLFLDLGIINFLTGLSLVTTYTLIIEIKEIFSKCISHLVVPWSNLLADFTQVRWQNPYKVLKQLCIPLFSSPTALLYSSLWLFAVPFCSHVFTLTIPSPSGCALTSSKFFIKCNFFKLRSTMTTLLRVIAFP